MQINFRLDSQSVSILYDINKSTRRSFSDIMRKLIMEGIISAFDVSIAGKTEHIVGVSLDAEENARLKELCEKYKIQQSECARRLLRGYVTKYSTPRSASEAIEMLELGRIDLAKNYIAAQSESLPIDDETPHDVRLLLWIPTASAWVIGRWDDDRYSIEPRPFWWQESEPRTYCRNNPPSHYRLIPPPVTRDA